MYDWYSALITKLDVSNQMLEQAITQIEEKINMVNDKINAALAPANNKQKTIQERR